MKKLLATILGILAFTTPAYATIGLKPSYPTNDFLIGNLTGLINSTTTPYFASFNFSNATGTSATTTNFAVTTLCLTGDTCRTTWPTGGTGITTIGDIFHTGLTGATQTFSTSTPDTNLGMTIVSSGTTHLFTPYWIGTLADGRIASASTWNAKLSSVTADSPLSGSGTLASHLTCTTAASGVGGCLSSTAFDTFNNKQATISVTYPVTLSGATVGLGFSTTTNNNWSGTNVFQNASSTFVGGLTIGGNSTTTNSTTTNGYFSNLASTTAFYGANLLSSCNGTTKKVTYTSGGVFLCETDQTSSGVTSVTGTYPIQSSGGNTPAISVAYGTTTNNFWSGTNVFQNASSTVVGSLTIGGNSTTTQATTTNQYISTSLQVGSSTPSFSGAGRITFGSNGTSGTTTISVGKIQFSGYTNTGGRVCAYIVGTAWVISAGVCVQ